MELVNEVLNNPLFWKVLAAIVAGLWGLPKVQEFREKLEDWHLKQLMQNAQVVLEHVYRESYDQSKDAHEVLTLQGIKDRAREKLRAKLEKEAPKLAKKYTDEALDWAVRKAEQAPPAGTPLQAHPMEPPEADIEGDLGE